MLPALTCRDLQGRLRRSTPVLSQTEGSHVTPNFANVGEAFCLCSPLTSVPPPGRILPAFGPDRILLLCINYHLVDDLIVLLVVRHLLSPRTPLPREKT